MKRDPTQGSLTSHLPTDWTFDDIWNKALLKRESRPVEPRSRLWASELGKSPIDLFLKLKGEEPSNPPDARSLRKFEAGNIWEWIVRLILLRAGVLRDSQGRVEFQYPGLLPVSGKIDFIAGGVPDYHAAKEEIERLNLPDVFNRAAEGIFAFFEKEYPNGLGDKILEIKSVSSFMFDSMERSGKSSRNHRIQLFHYLHGKNMARGDIVYICRDDCRMMQIPIINPSPVEDEYKREIEIISRYYERDEQPPLESLVVFDEDLGKFSRNFNVAYSGYLTKLYGFETQAEYEDIYRPLSEKFNRVLARAKKAEKRAAWLSEHGFTEENVQSELVSVEGKKARQRVYFVDTTKNEGDENGRVVLPKEICSGHEMTPQAKETIAEIEKLGFSFEKCVSIAPDEMEEVTEGEV